MSRCSPGESRCMSGTNRRPLGTSSGADLRSAGEQCAAERGFAPLPSLRVMPDPTGALSTDIWEVEPNARSCISALKVCAENQWENWPSVSCTPVGQKMAPDDVGKRCVVVAAGASIRWNVSLCLPGADALPVSLYGPCKLVWDTTSNLVGYTHVV